MNPRKAFEQVLGEDVQSAQEAYTRSVKMVANRLEHLKITLKRHAAKYQKDQHNWGYAGDLERAAELLDDIDDFLSEMPHRV